MSVQTYNLQSGGSTDKSIGMVEGMTAAALSQYMLCLKQGQAESGVQLY